MILQKAGPTRHSQEWLTTVIRCPGEWTNYPTANAKRSTAHGHCLRSSHSPPWPGKSQRPGNTDKASVGSEHLLWPSWWTKGLVRIAALLKTQLGYHWAGLWEKMRHRDALSLDQLCGQRRLAWGQKQKLVFSSGTCEPFQVSTRISCSRCSTGRSWGRPGNAFHYYTFLWASTGLKTFV